MTLGTEFFRRFRRIGGNGFFQFLQVDDRASERAGTGDGLGKRLRILVPDHGLAAQFQRSLGKRDIETLPQPHLIRRRQLPCSPDAGCHQLRREASAHPPDLGNRETGKDIRDVPFRHDKHAGRAFFADVVCDLRQRFRGSKADATGDTDPFQDRGADVQPEPVIIRGSGVNERFVNGILFDVRRKFVKDRDDAAGDVRIKFVIAGKQGQFLAVPQFKIRSPHGNAQRLELVGTADHTAVVIAQDSNGAPLQPGCKDPFAGDKKIVSVHQPDHGRSPFDKLVNHRRDDPEDPQLHAVRELDRRVVPVRRLQDYRSIRKMTEIFDRELVIDTGDHNISLLRLQTAVNNQNVAGMKTGTLHGIARNADKERSSRFADQ